MRYAGIIYNDFAAAPGVCLSFFSQGCPHHCPECHNQETWSYEGGREFSYETLSSIIKGLAANGIERSLCIMGGEPLCPENQFLTQLIISSVKKELPHIKIYIWSGYTYEELQKMGTTVQNILSETDYLIDGLYMKDQRDITLLMRGSRNQHIWNLKTGQREDS